MNLHVPLFTEFVDGDGIEVGNSNVGVVAVVGMVLVSLLVFFLLVVVPVLVVRVLV